jgi:hypothetical protein
VNQELDVANNWSFYDKPTELVPFSLRGYNGKVAVYYGSNDDPQKVGYDFLAGSNFDFNMCCGYPVIHARIEQYEGSGIRTFLGWLQIVTGVRSHAHDPKKAQTATSVSVDICPTMRESDIPFYSFGSLPQVFDAPCHNLGEYAELHWTADTFLTTLPIRSRDEEISWLAGFRWGYIENDLPDQKPVLLPLEITGAQAWNRHISFLQKEYSRWRFKPAD